MKNKKHILIFTGGHHTSGLAVARMLQSSQTQIIWFGHRHSSWKDRSDSAEYREVTQSNIKFINLQAGKFHRTYHPLKLLRLPWGFIQSFYHLIILKINHGTQIAGIVSFGGYLAVPVVICGWLLGIKSVTHEQTLVSGWANRVISIFCSKIALSWPQSQKYFPVDKCVVVGLPLRQEILDLKPEPTQSTIYITGGKQGSHLINSVILECLPKLLKNYTIIHQTGSNSLYRDFEKSQGIKSSGYHSFEYADSQTTAKNLQQASLVISRAGAHIMAELLYFQKPSVLIPIPGGSHHEQELNAQFLEALSQAIILPQSDLNPINLLIAIDKAQKLKPKFVKFDFNGLSNFAKLIFNEFLQKNQA